MHTFSNKIIAPQKISLLTLENKYRASEIVKYLIEKNIDFVNKNCDYLYKYYRYTYLNNEDNDKDKK